MNDRALLVTLGCSWVFGVGAAYQPGQSESEYRTHLYDRTKADLHSWRGKICALMGWHNLNLSEGGSSNQRQFRQARRMFGSCQWKYLRSRFRRVIVLWGITSTARNEVYSVELGKPYNFFYGRGQEPAETFSEFWIKHHYDHDYEVYQLCCEMRFWNEFFQSQDIENYWFDTINSHAYTQARQQEWDPTIWPKPEDFEKIQGQSWPTWKEWAANIHECDAAIQQELQSFWPDRPAWTVIADHSSQVPDRIIDMDSPRRDLIGFLCRTRGRDANDQQYRRGLWKRETDDIGFLVDQGLVNPWSMHPTQEAHAMIADHLLRSTHINIRS